MNPNRSLESNTPDGGKVRGNASQLFERYTNLAHDAQSAGDRVSAEAYLQYAEHYFRVLNAAAARRNGQGSGQGESSGQGHENAGAAAGGNGAGGTMSKQDSGPGDQDFDSEDEPAGSGPAVN